MSEPTDTPVAAIASLANPAGANNFLIWYNDSTTAQLLALTNAYVGFGDGGSAIEHKPHDLELNFGPADVPSGNILATSALTAAVHHGTLNVYGVLAAKQGGSLVCRLSPGFLLLNVGSPPLASAFSIAACSDLNNNGVLFFLGDKGNGNVRLYSLELPGVVPSPSQVSLSLIFNAASYLGAAYGTLPNTTPQAFAVVQDSDGALHLTSADGNIQKQVNGGKKALMNTPIAALFIDKRLVVYWFDPVGSSGTTDGSPLMRATLRGPGDDFTVKTLTAAPTPNGYTQLTAFVNPASVSVGGGSGTALITYVQNSSNTLTTYPDHLESND
ncbi:uncharacterized protein FTJAE_2603 [Fusarium tjaetaba]|uniref:Uncharacterized protein n=1 Tax=Fusarium tjaetaba TaxID=1567544 RepID=A0A8H5S395_9HYPO|nr:uncharacterized protein FTJAE_2603 [Fusarium tjaetaba]KAF5644979.1 hypothetical protein FTJAE_2603 [Fusarium tjaetaba]